jgi:hypothetical protein
MAAASATAAVVIPREKGLSVNFSDTAIRGVSTRRALFPSPGLAATDRAINATAIHDDQRRLTNMSGMRCAFGAM